MSYETLLIDKTDGIGTITLNRPEVLNAMSTILFKEMDHAVSDMESDLSLIHISEPTRP